MTPLVVAPANLQNQEQRAQSKVPGQDLQTHATFAWSKRGLELLLREVVLQVPLTKFLRQETRLYIDCTFGVYTLSRNRFFF